MRQTVQSSASISTTKPTTKGLTSHRNEEPAGSGSKTFTQWQGMDYALFGLSRLSYPVPADISSFQTSSYYDRRQRQSAALVRARRPYLVKNALLGLGIAAFAVGVCKHSQRPPWQRRISD